MKEKQLTLFGLAWPILIETALFMTLGIVDVFVLSQYNDLAAGAVNTANQAVSIATIVFTVVSTASAVLISQYLGAGKKQAAGRIAALAITLNLLTGLLVSALFLLFNRPILGFIGAKGELLALAGDYLSIVGGFIFLQSVLSVTAVIIRNHGMTKITMAVTVGMNVINTGLDILFVLGFDMGVTGVAIATTFSRVVGTAVLAVVLFHKIESPAIFRALKPFPWRDLGDMLKIGVPGALETFLYNLSQLVITAIVLNFLTEAELIAKTYVQNITMFFYIFAVAIGQASQILTGHLVGAGKTDEAYRRGFIAHRTALAISLSVCLIGVLLRYPLMGIFTENPAVIELGATVLLINIALEFGRTTNLVLIACLRGAGDVYFPTACAIFSMWLVSVLGSYLFAVVLGMGLYGLWIALAADEVVRGVLMICRWKSGKWKQINLIKER